jgi:hypothetical protein
VGSKKSDMKGWVIKHPRGFYLMETFSTSKVHCIKKEQDILKTLEPKVRWTDHILSGYRVTPVEILDRPFEDRRHLKNRK